MSKMNSTLNAETTAISRTEALAREVGNFPSEWALTPLSGKRPTRKGWQSESSISREKLQSEIRQGFHTGVGLRTGRASGGLIAIDVDGRQAEELLQLISMGGCDDTPTVSWTSGKPGRRQLLFQLSPDLQQRFESLNFTRKALREYGDFTADVDLDFRYDGCQSALPPSAHPETGQYRWLNSPTDCPIAEAPEWLTTTLEELLVGESQPTLDFNAPPQPARISQERSRPSTPSASSRAYGSLELPADVPPIPLYECLSRASQELVRSGISQGSRNLSGLQLAQDCLGAEDWLQANGISYEGAARELFEEYCQRCPGGGGWNQREWKTIWNSAARRAPGSSRNHTNPDALEKCVRWWIRENSPKSRAPEVKTVEVLPPSGADGQPKAKKLKVSTRSPEKRPPAARMADVLAERLGSELAWDDTSERWLHYDGRGKWCEISKRKVEKFAKTALNEDPRTGDDFSYNFLSETVKLMRCELLVEEWQEPMGYLNLADGVLNVRTRELLPHSPDFRFLHRLPYGWAERSIGCEPIQAWLKEAQLGDGGSVELLRAFLRALVTRDTSVQKFLLLQGGGGTGKSTFVHLARALVGMENCTSTTLKRLEESPYETAKLVDKFLVTIADSNTYRGEIGTLKAIVGGDSIPIEQKFKQQTEDRLVTGKIVITSNNSLECAEKSNALSRRLLLSVWNRKVEASQMRDLEREFAPYLPGLLAWVLEMPEARMKSVLNQTGGAASPVVTRHALENLADTNSVLGWAIEHLIVEPGAFLQAGVAKRNRSLDVPGTYERYDEWGFASYREFCEGGGLRAESINTFSKVLVNGLTTSPLSITEVTRQRTRGGTVIYGVRLRKPEDEHPDLIEYVLNGHKYPEMPNGDTLGGNRDNLVATSVTTESVTRQGRDNCDNLLEGSEKMEEKEATSIEEIEFSPSNGGLVVTSPESVAPPDIQPSQEVATGCHRLPQPPQEVVTVAAEEADPSQMTSPMWWFSTNRGEWLPVVSAGLTESDVLLEGRRVTVQVSINDLEIFEHPCPAPASR